MGSAKLDAAGHRWVAQLANYYFNIIYRSGKSNIDADGLSRIKWLLDLSEQVSTYSVHAVLDTIHVDLPLIDAVSLFCDVVPSESDLSDELLGFSQPEEIDWGRVQRDDLVLSLIFDLLTCEFEGQEGSSGETTATT